MSTLLAQFQALADELKAQRTAALAIANAQRPEPMVAPVAPTAPTMAQYITALQAHDWFYSMSDCHSTYTKGRNERDALLAMRVKLDPSGDVWAQHAFTAMSN